MRRFARRSWRGIARYSASIPLRIKLLTGAVTLVAIALAVISVVSIAVFHSYLLNQTGKQLENYVSKHVTGERQAPLFPGLSQRSGFRFQRTPGLGGFTLEVLDSKGQLVADQTGGPAGPSCPPIRPG